MSLPSENLSLDERAELEFLLSQLESGECKVSEWLAELILWRRVRPAIFRNRYLLNNDTVKGVLDRLPGSRYVPAANLPRMKRS